MELIGVMAILAILAAVMAPNFFRAINDAYAAAERENLQQLAEDLEHYVVTNKAIPSQSVSAWSAALSTISNYPEADIQDNQRGYQRAIYFDPRFFTTSDTSFSGYTQSSGVSSGPNSARIMIMSDMTADMPSLSSTTSEFDAIWDQDSGAAVLESNDVKIHRLNINNLFHRVILSNPNTSQTAYALDSGSQNPVPAASGGTDGVADFWVIEGTELRLFAPPYPSGSLSTVSLIDSVFSYSFEDPTAGTGTGTGTGGNNGNAGNNGGNNGVGGGSGGGNTGNRGGGNS